MDAIKAWKDVDYRDSLTDEQLAAVPPHPGGLVSLDLGELSIHGGAKTGNFLCFTITVSLEVCTQHSWCGSCSVASIGCC
jgi:mersacidin/lichenicidin family type 2 lantibiotic